MGFSVFQGFGRSGFSRFSDLGSWFFGYSDLRVSLDVRTFGFSDIDLGSSCLFRILVLFGIGLGLGFSDRIVFVC